jgi:hypothetical protein
MGRVDVTDAVLETLLDGPQMAMHLHVWRRIRETISDDLR